MNASTEKYLSLIHDAHDVNELAKRTAIFFKDELLLEDFYVISHQFHPHPYRLIFPENGQFDFEHWKDDFSRMNVQIIPFKEFQFGEFHYYFLDILYANLNGEFLVSKYKLPEQPLEILRIWNHVRRLVESSQNRAYQTTWVLLGNLLSQLMHDVQAIIDLSENVTKTEKIIKRFNYQKKVNSDVLFWIRECELIKTKIALRDLIYATLELINGVSDRIELVIAPDITDVQVDVELFSRAFNELIKNAAVSVENDYSKIAVHIEKIKSASPLIKNDWIKIQIRDTGSGISEDFLPFVMNPFFTTSKDKGSTGFGLAKAKKIIEAHHGQLEIKSVPGMGTIVKIYLPEF